MLVSLISIRVITDLQGKGRPRALSLSSEGNLAVQCLILPDASCIASAFVISTYFFPFPPLCLCVYLSAASLPPTPLINVHEQVALSLLV